MLDSARLLFIDELAANTKMVRIGSCCVRGDRLLTRVLHGHWNAITLVAALRRNMIKVPLVTDGAIAGKTFLAHVQKCLAPSRKWKNIVVMDNLPVHKVSDTQSEIETRGVPLRYLSEYTGSEPDRDAHQYAQGLAAEGRRKNCASFLP